MKKRIMDRQRSGCPGKSRLSGFVKMAKYWGRTKLKVKIRHKISAVVIGEK
jgi:hypothetical protein